eukprot:2289782-Alexandrium_andersonii.AAC.1
MTSSWRPVASKSRPAPEVYRHARSRRCNRLQQFASVCGGLRGCAAVCGGLRRFAAVCSGLQ